MNDKEMTPEEIRAQTIITLFEDYWRLRSIVKDLKEQLMIAQNLCDIKEKELNKFKPPQ